MEDLKNVRRVPPLEAVRQTVFRRMFSFGVMRAHNTLARVLLPDQVRRNKSRYRCYQRLLADVPELRLIEFDEHEETSFKNIVVELCDRMDAHQ